MVREDGRMIYRYGVWRQRLGGWKGQTGIGGSGTAKEEYDDWATGPIELYHERLLQLLCTSVQVEMMQERLQVWSQAT